MKRQTSIFTRLIIGLLSSVFWLAGAYAEEGGSGHYFPGSIASFMDGVSADPTFIARINYAHYDGDAEASLMMPIGGQTALDVNAKSDVLALTLFWAPDWSLGDKWSYAMSTTIPWVSIEVAATVSAVSRADKETGLGDIVLMPLMFNYAHSADLNSNYRITIYAPTGSYEVGRLANTGKNFWTIEPAVGMVYLGQKNGIEASLFGGIDFNTENNDTNYKSGTQAHLDGTIAQHLPLWGGLASFGATGFWYQQITGDSGSGATFGDFKAKAQGIGPVVSFASEAGQVDIISELKWLHEFNNENRLEGDTLFLKVMAKF